MSTDSCDGSRQEGLLGISGGVGALTLVALGALLVAAHARAAAPYYDGLMFCALAVLLIFLIIKRRYDRAEGIVVSGVPLLIRAAVGLAVCGMVYGPAPDASAGTALVIAVMAGATVFALLSAIHWVMVTTR
jgi:hypothetical protein